MAILCTTNRVSTSIKRGRKGLIEQQSTQLKYESLILILLKNNNRSMGNIEARVRDQNRANLEVKQSKGAYDTRLIGPSHLSFHKVIPKNLDPDEDLVNSHEDSTNPNKLESSGLTSDDDSGDDTVEDNGSKNMGEVEAIKIKWNSFIKMKKKNYLEDYAIIKEIGKGGFGTVSKVQAKYTGVFRAAKKIKKSSMANTDHEKLFAEMAIMMTLDHPGIARLFEVYDYKSSYVLILELCEGGQLFKKIVAQSLNEAAAANIMIKLLQALLYLHAKGIVHRDLKPQNILFESNHKSSNPKLIDFGIAVKRDSNIKLTTRIGTPYYIAPEVLCKSYDEKCDIWSAGVILYMMITYRPPFNGDSETEVMENILKTEPSYSNVHFKIASQDCINFIKKLLTKKPQNRPTAAQAFSHPWIQRYLKSSKINHQSQLENIASFKFDNSLEAVVYTFIVSQILTSQQKETIKQLFEKLDQNHDGVISTEELRQALLSRKDMSEQRVAFLMRMIDTNNSGVIDFTEFIVAALEPQNLSRSHFEQAFNYFDIDHSGVITYEEILAFLEQKSHSENEIRQIFKDFDQNHDGEISKQEFLRVLCLKGKERLERQRHKSKKYSKYSTQKDKKQ